MVFNFLVKNMIKKINKEGSPMQILASEEEEFNCRWTFAVITAFWPNIREEVLGQILSSKFFCGNAKGQMNSYYLITDKCSIYLVIERCELAIKLLCEQTEDSCCVRLLLIPSDLSLPTNLLILYYYYYWILGLKINSSLLVSFLFQRLINLLKLE